MPEPEPWEPTYEAHTGDAQLDTLMALAYAAGAAVARTEELRTPVLVCLTEDDALQSYHLITDTSPTSPTATEMAHVALVAARATHAAYCFEGWEAGERALTPEMIADHEAGRPMREPPGTLRPSEDPTRRDVLMLIGEIKGRPQVVRRWWIDPGPDGTRVFVARPDLAPDGTGAQLARSKVTPLFRDRSEVRALIRRHATLQRWRDQAAARRN